MTVALELCLVKQELRTVCEAKHTLGGMVDMLLEQNADLEQQIRDLQTTKRALTASCVRLFEESERHAAERDALLKVIQRHGMQVSV